LRGPAKENVVGIGLFIFSDALLKNYI